MPIKYPEEFIIRTVKQHEAGTPMLNFATPADFSNPFHLYSGQVHRNPPDFQPSNDHAYQHSSKKYSSYIRSACLLHPHRTKNA